MLYIKDIDEKNIFDVLKLTVDLKQEKFIESIGDSIAESKYFRYWNVVAFYDDSKIVGFGMYGKIESEDGRVWLDRYMIDKKYQGVGYGKKFLVLIMKKIEVLYSTQKIYLSIYKENLDAIKLYKNFNFQFNGELDTKGELVMCCNLYSKKRSKE